MAFSWASNLFLLFNMTLFFIGFYLLQHLVLDPRPSGAAHAPNAVIVRLADGRALAYAQHGDIDSEAVVVFLHDSPGSRLQRHAQAHDLAEAAGVRVVSVDRPGLGLSSPAPAGYRLVDWADDLEQLLSTLALPRGARVSLAAMGTGASYALATVFRHPERIHAVALVGPHAPPESVLAANPALHNATPTTLFKYPWLMRIALRFLRSQVFRNPAASIPNLMKKSLLPSEQSLLTPEAQTMLRDDIQEAFFDSVEGVARDLAVERGDWGFRLDQLNTTEIDIYIWAGLEDTVAPVSGARLLESALPVHSVSAEYLEQTGHAALLLRHWPAILQQLTAIHIN